MVSATSDSGRDGDTDKHHRRALGMYLHNPDTCTLHRFIGRYAKDLAFDRRELETVVRYCPSRKGLVAMCYEKDQYMTFWAQMDEERGAWQRIEWQGGFEDWGAVQEAVRHFLDVAECAMAHG